MKYCSVPVCNGKSGFPFPKVSELRKKWLEAIAIANTKIGSKQLLWQPTSSDFVCEKHFQDSGGFLTPPTPPPPTHTPWGKTTNVVQ